jgi:hypothetical protein
MTSAMTWRRQLGWRPRELAWRTAVLFMVGSVLFALGSVPPYAELVDPRIVGVTFVVGSVFFTAAACHQLAEVIDEPAAGSPSGHPHGLAGQVRRLAWWATVVQLVGTLFFNASTIDAMIQTLDTQQVDRLVWGPDLLGSIAFLVASHLAWLDTNHRAWAVHRDDERWWIAALNYGGSIWFMVAALASFVLPTTGEIVNIRLVNGGTFVGAVGFFVGAYLLLPQRGVGAGDGNRTRTTSLEGWGSSR